MLEKISHLITGYVKIAVTGRESYRFLNLCMKSGLSFWGYKNKSDGYSACMRFKEYKKLRHIKRRCDVKIKLTKKCGLPLRLNIFKKRKGLAFGLLFSIALYCFLLSRVWVISVEGSGIHTKEEILEVAQNAGVYISAPRSGFSERYSTMQMLLELEHLEWATVNTQGCTVTLAVKHKEDAPEIIETDENIVQNIVASKAGIIKSIEAQDGKVWVEVGDTVYENELLVSGVWDSNINKDEWAKTDDVTIFMTKARATIIAQTERSFEASMEKTKTNYERGDSFSQYSLNFFGLNLPLNPLLIFDGEYEKRSQENSLYLLDLEMPVGINQNTFTRLYPYETIISEETAKTLLEEELLKQIEESGVEIIEMKETNLTLDGGLYNAKIDVICYENISKEQQVFIG